MRQSNRLAVYIFILVLFFLESSFFYRLRIFETRPELLLIVTVFFGFQSGALFGLEIGAIAGALKDAFSVTGFGVNTFSFLLIGYLAGFFKDKLFKEGFIRQFTFSNIAIYVLSGVHFFYMSEILRCEVYQNFWKVAFLKGLYTGFLTPLLFFILGKLFR